MKMLRESLPSDARVASETADMLLRCCTGPTLPLPLLPTPPVRANQCGAQFEHRLQHRSSSVCIANMVTVYRAEFIQLVASQALDAKVHFGYLLAIPSHAAEHPGTTHAATEICTPRPIVMDPAA